MLSAYNQTTFYLTYTIYNVIIWKVFTGGNRKMKNIKKFTAVFMAMVIILCSFSFAVYAEDQSTYEEKNYVAAVYLCQKSQPPYINGHTWLYFENLTSSTLTVGIYQLPKGQGVSVGTYGYAIKDGRGLYYNVAGYRYNHPKTDDFICLKKYLTQDQLDIMSSKITYSGTWLYLLNCSFSAITTWDMVLGKFVPYLIFPILVRLCILMYPQHQSGFYLYSPKSNQIFKQVGRGSRATLVPADPVVPKD